MSKVLLGIVIGGLALFAWQRAHPPPPQAVHTEEPEALVETSSEPARFHCDGRVYCSQMTSCEEATYFLQHCPGVKMDGEGDGVPCEKQWCGRR